MLMISGRIPIAVWRHAVARIPESGSERNEAAAHADIRAAGEGASEPHYTDWET